MPDLLGLLLPLTDGFVVVNSARLAASMAGNRSKYLDKDAEFNAQMYQGMGGTSLFMTESGKRQAKMRKYFNSAYQDENLEKFKAIVGSTTAEVLEQRE